MDEAERKQIRAETVWLEHRAKRLRRRGLDESDAATQNLLDEAERKPADWFERFESRLRRRGLIEPNRGISAEVQSVLDEDDRTASWTNFKPADYDLHARLDGVPYSLDPGIQMQRRAEYAAWFERYMRRLRRGDLIKSDRGIPAAVQSEIDLRRLKDREHVEHVAGGRLAHLKAQALREKHSRDAMVEQAFALDLHETLKRAPADREDPESKDDWGDEDPALSRLEQEEKQAKAIEWCIGARARLNKRQQELFDLRLAEAPEEEIRAAGFNPQQWQTIVRKLPPPPKSNEV